VSLCGILFRIRWSTLSGRVFKIQRRLTSLIKTTALLLRQTASINSTKHNTVKRRTSDVLEITAA